MDICTFLVCEDGVATMNSELQNGPMTLVFVIGFIIGLAIMATRPWRIIADMNVLSYTFVGLVAAATSGLVAIAIYVAALGIALFLLAHHMVLVFLMGSIVALVAIYIFRRERHEDDA